jgi:hypothetical protein
VAESGTKWRFFRRPKAPFLGFRAGDARSQTANLLDLTTEQAGWREARLNRQIGDEAPLFTVQDTI